VNDNDSILIARIDERVGRLLKDNEEFKESLKSCKMRISALEGWQNRIIGLAIACPILIPIIICLIVEH